MKTKHCPHCNLDLPRDQFSSTQAKYCLKCTKLVALEKMYKAQNKRLKVLEQKASSLGMPQLKAKVQRALNKFCRDRDVQAGLGCISCGKHKTLQGGHYIAQGSCSFLRYHPDNIHGQCDTCNRFLSGNLIEYRINLVKKIGEDRVAWLEANRHQIKKWSREELTQLLERYR